LAIALAGLTGSPATDLARRLLESPDPWTRAHVLQSLAVSGEGLELARESCRRESQPLLQILAIRAIAASSSPEAGHALLELLPQASEAVQAVIITALAGARDPADSARAREAAATFVTSSSARL